MLKSLFWGDNEVHEFWESDDSELLMMRNHREQFWTVHRNHGFLFGCRSAEEGAGRINAELNRSRTWTKQGGKFVLKQVTGQSPKSSSR